MACRASIGFRNQRNAKKGRGMIRARSGIYRIRTRPRSNYLIRATIALAGREAERIVCSVAAFFKPAFAEQPMTLRRRRSGRSTVQVNLIIGSLAARYTPQRKPLAREDGQYRHCRVI